MLKQQISLQQRAVAVTLVFKIILWTTSITMKKTRYDEVSRVEQGITVALCISLPVIVAVNRIVGKVTEVKLCSEKPTRQEAVAVCKWSIFLHVIDPFVKVLFGCKIVRVH